MKRVFISYPMNGVDPKEIAVSRAVLSLTAQYIVDFGEEVEVIDNWGCSGKDSDGRLYYLGEAIKKMDKCDIVVFHPSFRRATGCIIEHEVAERYGLETRELEYGAYEVMRSLYLAGKLKP